MPLQYGWFPPASPEKVEELDPVADRPVMVRVAIAGDLFTRSTQWPILVDSWRLREANSCSRRVWAAAFTKAEDTKLRSLHAKFEVWYLSTGAPQHVLVLPSTIAFVERAVAVLASL